MFPPRTASRSTVSSSSGSGRGCDWLGCGVDLAGLVLAVFADVLGGDCDRLNVSGFGGEGLLGDHLDSFVGRVRDLRGEEADGAEGVVVAWEMT